jgi:UDP-N-acetylmuramate--alanine ligase
MIALSELASKKLHFIGIGGAGMSGLARIALTHGAHVSGSDEKDSSVLAALSALGATVFSSHKSSQVTDADLVIYSNAISKSNPEIAHANELGIPVYTRAQALALLMSQSISIAVAGTHGKTTTSSMLTVALQACGVDPSFAIGGTISASGSNAHRGTGDYFVAEADESDGSFVEYRPFGAIVTNVEHDHVDYFATPADVTAAFEDFVATISHDGFLVYCADDPGSKILGESVKNITAISYGENAESELHIDQIELSAKSSRARALWKGKSIGHLELNIPGRHNIDNAAAALAVGLHLGLPTSGLLAGLASYAGTGRRFELKGTVHGIRVIDDYGHHPTEIRVTLDAARRYAGDGRLLVIFQPHRYSRTRAFMSDFASALSLADNVILLEVYAASEKPISGVSSEVISESMANGEYIPNFIEATDAIIELAKPGDVIMTLGAGDVSSLGPIIIDGLSKRFANN